ncbi:hypothetical protein KKH43_05905 [Patescibacteria group bacterium]|nr:hypothetical protein [Patescibacteria group bacterium]
MDTINVLLGILVLLNSLLGVILLSRPRKLSAISYFLFVCGVILWTGAMILFRASSQQEAVVFCRVLYVAATFTVSPFLYFTFIFLNSKRSAVRTFSILIPQIVIIILTFFTPYIIKDVFVIPGAENFIFFGQLYFLYVIYISGYFIYGFINLFKKYKNATGISKVQVKYVLLGSIFAATFAMITNLILPWFEIFTFNWLGQIFSLFMIVFTVLAIIKYHLLDLRIVLRKSFVYAGTYFSIILINYFLYSSVHTYLYQNSMFIFWLILILLSLFLLEPTKKFYFTLANKYFFTSLADYQETIYELTEKIPTYIEIEKMGKEITTTLTNAMKIEKIALYSVSPKEEYTFCLSVGESFFPKSLNMCHHALEFLRKKSGAIDVGLIQSLIQKEKCKTFNRTLLDIDVQGVSLLLPIKSRNGLIAFMLLGKKITGEGYSRNDLEVLLTISRQAAIAFENAYLYQRVKEFSADLQKEVERKTKDLKYANRELTKLVDEKSLLLKMINHQIRSPLTNLMNYLSFFKKGNSEASSYVRHEYIDATIRAAECLNKTTHDLLYMLELDSEKVSISDDVVNIDEALSKFCKKYSHKFAVLNISTLFKKKGLRFAIRANTKLFEELVTNIFDNIYYYSEKGNVEINLCEKDHEIELEIINNIIIPAKITEYSYVKRISRRFERGVNATNRNPGGTGLGLLIMRKIVERGNGRMDIVIQNGKFYLLFKFKKSLVK